MTTTETVTAEQIETLRTEASEAGNAAQVVLCDAALAGDEGAKAKCVRAIRSAEAMADSAGHCDHCDTELTGKENALAVDTEQGEHVCAACQSLHAADAEQVVASGTEAGAELVEQVREAVAAAFPGAEVHEFDPAKGALADQIRASMAPPTDPMVTSLAHSQMAREETEKLLLASFTPFGTLGGSVDGSALAAAIVRFTKIDDVAERARLAGEILANLWRSLEHEQDVCSVEFDERFVRLRTPNSGTVIECSNGSVRVDFGPKGSAVRALTILRAADAAGIRFGWRKYSGGPQALTAGGASLSRGQVLALLLAAEARDDARTFVNEFKTALDPETTDWDANAYGQSSLAEEADEELGESAWLIYQRALIMETRRLVGPIRRAREPMAEQVREAIAAAFPGTEVHEFDPAKGSLVAQIQGSMEWRGYYSLDNGSTWHAAGDLAITDYELAAKWDALVEAMDDAAREATHDAVAPCSHREFLAEYLRRTEQGLVIG